MIRRETLVVQNLLATKGTSGQTKYVEPDGAPIELPVNSYPLSAEETATLGLQDHESRRVFADTWPATRRAQLRIRGALWEQVGPVQVFDALPGNAHVEVTIKRIGDA